MVKLDTLGALQEHDHQHAAYSPTCERWAVLDLAGWCRRARRLLLRRQDAL